MSELADARARSRILTEFGRTLFVEAAAGTGKTTALVGRIVGMIRSGAGMLAGTVAVTFTEKAAGEMKLRLRLKIEEARSAARPEELTRLDLALEQLELARIGTIHAFCGDLLGERPIEARVDPVFKMIGEEDADALVDEAFNRWLERILAAPPEGVRRILRRRSGRDSPQEGLRAAMHTLCDHRDFSQPWRRDPFDRDQAIDALLSELEAVGDLAERSSSTDLLTRNLSEIARFVREVTRLEAVRDRDYDELEADLRELARNRDIWWDRTGFERTTFGDLSRDEVLARCDIRGADRLGSVAPHLEIARLAKFDRNGPAYRLQPNRPRCIDVAARNCASGPIRRICKKHDGEFQPFRLVHGHDPHAFGSLLRYGTRARDLLVVPAYGDGPRQGWYEVLDPVLYPSESARRNSTPAPGCPAFGEESVLARGPKGKRPAAGSVRPGLHISQPEAAPVVWWDPAVLRLEVEELAPLRHQRILEMDDAGAAEASERSYAAWKSERESLLTKASEPSLSVRTITSHIRTAGYATEASGQGDEPHVHIERLERADQKRPGGRRFGALVHALLASIDLKANADAIQAAAIVHGRMVGATEHEISAAIPTISRVLHHPVLRRAAASSGNGVLRRETPVLLRLSDGCLVEGVVDLAFRDDTPGFAGWTVVDFKTDREFDESSDHYIAQVTIYSKAVGAAMNSSTRGVLLVV